jgi:glutathionyl-hydroquinone reductase
MPVIAHNEAHEPEPRLGSALAAGEHRYRLYVSYACPWSHRVLIKRALLQLNNALPAFNVDPVMDEIGWRLGEGQGHLLDVYRRFLPRFEGRATVPLLVDEQEGTIVSNESADIGRLLGPLLGGRAQTDVLPAEPEAEVERLNLFVQTQVNEAVYRVGFSLIEAERLASNAELLDTLAGLNASLGRQRYLVDPDRPLEPDWRLWATLVRYEPAYRPFFLRCDAPPLSAYRHLSRFADDLMRVPGIAATFRAAEVAAHYAARAADLKRRRAAAVGG